MTAAPSPPSGIRSLPSRAWRARWHGGWEVLLFVLLTVAYEWARDLVAPGDEDAIARAFHHAEDVVALESALGLHIEPWSQDATHAIPGGEFVTTWYYTLAHTPGFILFFAFMWWFRREWYPFVRNWFWGAHIAAVTIFWLYPLAPPRFLGLGLEDTTAEALKLGGALDWFQPFRNEFAAMPSLHIGYSFFYALALSYMLRNLGAWRYLVWFIPVWMTWVTMATANHYWIDGLAGAACMLAALLVVHLVSARDIARPWSFRAPRPRGAAPVAPEEPRMAERP
jgi:hypothetical protein